uniref:Secreted protein ASP-2 n=1 Tax=Ancylostoma caninum TaxID=29170 RepID=O77221_ANCCA|nr:secreted protein ASP-2 precursor [Ancylostoma caninum]
MLVLVPLLALLAVSVHGNSMRCGNNGMTDEARQKFLDVHNSYRSMVAKGQAKDAISGNAPKAAKMKKMIYDCNVESTAMQNAKKCVFAHSHRKGVGENIWMSTARQMDKAQAAQQASDGWFSELAKYGVGQENKLTTQLWNRGVMIGHYTQMVWQESYKLGCYVEWCSSMTYGVCQYSPQGNMMNSLIYEKGNPCTKDSDCGSNASCSAGEALCVVRG